MLTPMRRTTFIEYGGRRAALTGEFVDGQTIGQPTGEFVYGQTIIGQPTGEFVDGQTIVELGRM